MTKKKTSDVDTTFASDLAANEAAADQAADEREAAAVHAPEARALAAEPPVSRGWWDDGAEIPNDPDNVRFKARKAWQEAQAAAKESEPT